MYNRYSLTADLADLTAEFGIDSVRVTYEKRQELSPTAEIPVIQQEGDERSLNGQRWGLMPYWGKNSIHAGRDTLFERPYLRSMITKNRCVIPCSGFFEWREEGKGHVPWRVTHARKSIFGLAATFDLWLDSEKRSYPMCTIVTTSSAADPMRSVPLVVDEQFMNDWLNPKLTKAETVYQLLRELPEAELRSFPAIPSGASGSGGVATLIPTYMPIKD
jgi:putative SOS response-associated peptidase YedK